MELRRSAPERISELDIPSYFNELDSNEGSDCVLRTVVGFSLQDEEGRQYSIEELNPDMTAVVSLRGSVIEPFDQTIREAVIGLLCTSSTTNENENSSSSASSDTDDKIPMVVELDRDNLKVGDSVDGYCNKTFKWFEAKIVDASSTGDRVKLHFKGWSAKHDEWLSRQSDRIAALGTSSALMEAAAKRATSMVPWFDIEKVTKLVKQHSSSFEPRSCCIDVPCVNDWCIDYSYANPTLWVISSENIWYRLCGTLCPGGRLGQPSPAYSQIFMSSALRFSCAAHVAMVLLDFLPSLPKMGLNVVSDEVFARSSGDFDEKVILSNWKLLHEQLSTITPPLEWDCSVNIAKSIFMSQLKKQGEAYIRGGGKPGLVLAPGSVRSKKRVVDDSAFRQDTPPLGSSAARKLKKSVDDSAGTSTVSAPIISAATILKQMMMKIRFPIEDLDYWALQSNYAGSKPLPLPIPQYESCESLFGCSSCAIGSLLEAWTTIINFRGLLQLPYISLSDFSKYLMPGYRSEHIRNLENDPENNRILSVLPSTIHPMLREISIALLSALLIDKLEADKLDELKLLVSDREFSGDDIQDDENDKPINCFSGWFPADEVGFDELENRPRSSQVILLSGRDGGATIKVENNDPGHLLHRKANQLARYLRTGDTWVEILRTYIAAFNKIELAEYLDPLSECQRIIEILIADPEFAAFTKPVDPDRDGAPDYCIVIREPIDLGTILERIRNGWYDESLRDVNPICGQDVNTDQERLCNVLGGSSVQDDTVRFRPGDRVDVFSETAHRWYEGEVRQLKLCNSERKIDGVDGDAHLLVVVRIRGWGDNCDVEVAWNSDRIAPLGSLSRRLDTRHLDPVEANSRSLWDSSDAEFKSSISPPLKWIYGASSNVSVDRLSLRGKFGGHDAVAADVQLVCDNCVKYMSRKSPEHELVGAAHILSTTFKNLYQARVAKPLAKASVTSRKVLSIKQNLGVVVSESQGAIANGADDWSHVVSYLSQHDYGNASVEIKLMILNWACAELLSTSRCHEFMNEMVTRFQQRERRSYKTSSKEGDSSTISFAIASSASVEDGCEIVEPAKKKKRPSMADSTSNLQRTEDAVVVTKDAGKLVLDAVPTLGSSHIVAANGGDGSLNSEQFDGVLRLKPLGKDRDYRNYWTFSCDGSDSINSPECFVPPRLFCEDLKSGEWFVYSDIMDLSALMNWLSEKGIRESSLKKAISDWMASYNLVPIKEEPIVIEPPVRGSSWRKSNSATLDPPSAVVENKVTPIEMVTMNPCVQHQPILDLARWWVPTENGAICMLVRIPLQPGFQLGLGLKPVSGLVIVSGLKNDAQGNCVGKNAGMRIGDIILAVEGVQLVEIAQLQAVIRNLLAPSQQSASESLVESSYLLPENEGLTLRLTSRNSSLVISRASRTPLLPPPVPPPTPPSEESCPESLTYLHLLVLRHANPSAAGSHFQIAMENDANLKASFKAQELQDLEIMVATNMRTIHHFREHMVYPSRLVGMLMSMVSRANHPFCVPEAWASTSIAAWMSKLSSLLSRISQAVVTWEQLQLSISGSKKVSKSQSKIETAISDEESAVSLALQDLRSMVKLCLIDFESALVSAGNMLRRSWFENRRRYKWRDSAIRSNTCGQLSLAAVTLSNAIDWSRLQTSCNCLSLSSWLSTAPKHIATFIPPENSQVVYYGDGHYAEYELDSKLGRPGMWGQSGSAERFRGLVLPCTVISIRVLLSGPPEKFFPFAQVDLAVSASNLNHTPTTLLESNDSIVIAQAGSVYRAVNRVVNILRVVPEANAFLEPVSPTDFPDYYEKILNPIALDVIRLRAREGYYLDVASFLGDMALLRDNCHQYCRDVFPDVILQVDRLWAETNALIECFLSIPVNAIPILSGDSIGRVSESSAYPMDCTAAVATCVDADTSRGTAELSSSASAKKTVDVEALPTLSAVGNPRGTALRGIPLSKDQVIGTSSSFTVCMRLSSASLCPFLVPTRKYSETSSKFQLGTIVRTVANRENGYGDPVTPGFRYGCVTGCKAATSGGFIPWEWLEVEWADGFATSGYANPWDLEIVTAVGRNGSLRRKKL